MNDANSTPLSAQGLNWDLEQECVITANASDRLLVSAAPGSGKTAVACSRVANLISNGLAPANILLVSFTRTAVKEIRERIASYLTDPRDAGAVRITTLDSQAWFLAQGFDVNAKNAPFKSYDENIETVIALLKNPRDEVLDFLETVEHVIIDEAQDLVGARAELVTCLIKNLLISCGITVFFDEAQGIYGFTNDADTPEDANGEQKKAPSLVDQLASNTDFKFDKIELITIHRTKSPLLKKIFQKTRNRVLETAGDANLKLEQIRDEIAGLADGKVSDVLTQSLAGRDDLLVLFRRRSEVLNASSLLLSKGVKHRIRMSGTPTCIAPWIGMLLGDFRHPHLSKVDFEKQWSANIVGTPAATIEPDEAWRLLFSSAGETSGRIELKRLRERLAVQRPPLAFCRSDLGSSGPVIGTIHASKGREAPHVHLMLPAFAKSKDAAEETRVVFVGATRAKETLKIGSGYHFRTSPLSSGRTCRLLSGKLAASIEFGRDGDVDLASPVLNSTGKAMDSVSACQLILAKNCMSVFKLVLTLERTAGGDFYTRITPETSSFGVELGRLSKSMVSDLFNVGKMVLPRGKVRPASAIHNVFCFGARTVVIRPDDPVRETLTPPYSESGFYLAPIIWGFPAVFYSYRR